MKRVKRLVVIGIGVLLLVSLSIPFWIDRAARMGVEKGTEFALGVPTKLGSADIGILAGRTELSALNIGNPAGFESDHFLKLDRGRLAVSLASLTTDKVDVPEFSLDGIDVNLEKRLGKGNYQVIMDNLGRFESKKDPQEAESQGKRFIIREIVIRNVRVNADLLPIGGSLTKVSVPIDELRLTNVGSDADKGIVLAELTGTLLKAIVTAAIQKGGGIIPDDVLGDLRSSLAGLESLDKVGATLALKLDGTLKQLNTQASELVGQAGKQLDSAAKGLAEQATSVQDSLTKGLGGRVPKKEAKKP